MDFLSVDRIEENYLVCENQDEEIKIIEYKNLDENISEGSIIYIDNSGNIKLDEEKTKIRRNLIRSLEEKLVWVNEILFFKSLISSTILF